MNELSELYDRLTKQNQASGHDLDSKSENTINPVELTHI